jgi:hypothetical protein
LVDKSLRYHLRCNLIRYSAGHFATAGGGRPAGWGSDGREGGFLFASLFIFYILSCATAAGMMLNLLGFRRSWRPALCMMPAPLGDALRAGSLASMLLRLVVVLMAFVFWMIFYWREPKSWRMIAILSGCFTDRNGSLQRDWSVDLDLFGEVGRFRFDVEQPAVARSECRDSDRGAAAVL